MQFEDISTVANSDLPSSELADYLQLQSDATGAVRQDQHLDSALRAAIHEIESRTGRVVLEKKIELNFSNSQICQIEFGKADNARVSEVIIGEEYNNVLNESDFSFNSLKHSSELRFLSNQDLKCVTVRMFVGKSHWDEVSEDLKMAVITLASHYYENRFEMNQKQIGIPKLVESLIEKHRKLRILKG